MRSSVLVVDNDPQHATPLTGVLMGRGYDVQMATDTESTLSSLRSWSPSLIMVDLGPKVNGLDLCRLVRQGSKVPLIMISANADTASEVAALDAGADDYIVRPFSTDRLLARVRAALRRSPPSEQVSAIGVGAFHIDFNDRRVRVHGQTVRLTPKEFELFAFMARHPNRVLPHKTLLGAVWGQSSEDQSEYLRVFVGQLRKKLETDPAHPQYLVTEPWVGYRFNPAGLVQ